MHLPGEFTEVGMVENVPSTRIKLEFCKPATKSDSNTSLEKGLVQFRDGNDTWPWWHFELKTCIFKNIKSTAMLFVSKVAGHLFGQDQSGCFLCFCLLCILEHVRWRHWIIVRFMKSYLPSEFLRKKNVLIECLMSIQYSNWQHNLPQSSYL